MFFDCSNQAEGLESTVDACCFGERGHQEKPHLTLIIYFVFIAVAEQMPAPVTWRRKEYAEGGSR